MRAWSRLIRRREPYTAPTHAGRLERWLGAEKTRELSQNFRDWRGPPVAVGGVPGAVYVTAGGDFVGEIRSGAELSGAEYAREVFRREQKRRFLRAHYHQIGAFTSLSALISAGTGGKMCRMMMQKTSVNASAIGGSMDLWGVGGQPAAGAAGAAAPTGTSPTNATTGNLGFVNAVVNANTSHFINAWVVANAANTLLLADRLLEVAKTMSSSTTEAVTGTFSRYQNATATADDYIGGNFCYPRCSAVLAAVAHNWTVCQYTNQAGTTAQSFPSATGISACPAHQVDLAVGPNSWFMPLASGDVGVKALSQMQCSAATVTGTLDFIVAHAITVFPVPLVNVAVNIDGVASAFNFSKVFDNACLYILELNKPATAATTYSAIVSTCSE